MKKDDYLTYLGQVPMFRGCSPKQLVSIGKVAERYDVVAGEVMFKQGDTGHEFFLILEGSGRVLRDGSPVADLFPGDFFGELAVLHGGRRDATVEMASEGRVLSLSQQALFAVLADNPQITRQLLSGLALRLQDADGLPR